MALSELKTGKKRGTSSALRGVPVPQANAWRESTIDRIRKLLRSRRPFCGKKNSMTPQEPARLFTRRRVCVSDSDRARAAKQSHAPSVYATTRPELLSCPPQFPREYLACGELPDPAILAAACSTSTDQYRAVDAFLVALRVSKVARTVSSLPHCGTTSEFSRRSAAFRGRAAQRTRRQCVCNRWSKERWQR